MFEDANGNTSQSLTTNLLTVKNNVADPTVTGWNATCLTQFADKDLVKLNKVFSACTTTHGVSAFCSSFIFPPPRPQSLTPCTPPSPRLFPDPATTPPTLRTPPHMCVPMPQGLPDLCPGRSQAACH